MSVTVCVCACAFLAAVTELLLCFVLKVEFYIMIWNVTYKCVCVCVCAYVHARVCVLNVYFTYLSLRRRTIFYIGTLLILTVCVCACV